MSDSQPPVAIPLLNGAALVPVSPNEGLAVPREGPDPLRVYLLGYPSKKSRQTMLESLQRVAAVMGAPVEAIRWERLDFARTSVIRAALVSTHRPATVGVTLTALRGVLKTCWRLELMTHEQYARAVDWPKFKLPFAPPAGRDISPEEIHKIAVYLAAQGASGIQTAAIFAVMLGGGLRVFEVCGLRVDHYAMLAKTIRVAGKGGKVVDVPLGIQESLALDSWILLREKQVAADNPFVFLRGGSKWNNQALERLVAQTAGNAGCSHMRPHDLRRTFCTRLLSSGVDVLTVSRLMRHENVETTKRYDRRQAEVDAAARRAVQLWEDI